MRRDRKTGNMFTFSWTMAAHSNFYSFPSKCVFLTLLVALCAAKEICDQSKCPGPLKHYKDLECKPIYKNPGDCCAQSFDCSHLDKLSKDKCYVNGHEYSIGEKLREEDANSCDVGCYCSEGFEDSSAFFNCALLDCPYLQLEENCYYRWTSESCCPAKKVCLKEGEKRATCEVDGEVHKDGESFTPKSDPDLDCHCLPGYTGENIEPFCKKPNHKHCDPLFRYADQIHRKCAPVYNKYVNRHFDCSYSSRCAYEEDSVVHADDAKSVSNTDESSVCKMGNLTMHIGDTLKLGKDSFDTACIKCECEVPPIPTCTEIEDCTFFTLIQ